MTAPVGNQSRKLHQAMRELVAAFLSGEGFDAAASPVHTKISTAIEAGLQPDVVGLEGIWLDVSARGAHRLSVDLDAARAVARAAGYGVTALIQHRSARGVDEAYAVLTLGDLVKLARAAETTP